MNTTHLHLVASTDVTTPAEIPGRLTVHTVEDCLGREWAVSPARRAVWVLTGPPEVVSRRLADALAVFTGRRPQLTIVGGAR